jgi:hypothetical protein
MSCGVVRPDTARPQSPASVASAGPTRPGRREERPLRAEEGKARWTRRVAVAQGRRASR